MSQSIASYQCLHFKPVIKHVLDATLGGKSNLFKFWMKCGKEMSCPNT